MDQGVVGSSGGRLGGLRVWTERDSPQRERQLIWRLVNAQGAGWRLARAPILNADGVQLELEGSWAAGAGRHGVIAVDDIVLLDGDCAPAPPQSRPAAGDCDFTHDACGWSNSTTDEPRQQRWRLAAPLAAQAPRILLTDHTFRDAGGYIYFDLFSPQDRREQLRMVSPLLEPPATGGGGAGACVAFWLAHLSPSEPTQLRVLLEVVTSGVGDDAQFGEPTVLWSVRASETGARRLTWLYGQAGFRATQSYRITFEGDASKYGFALDDITFTSGDCEVRPSNAAPNEGAREQRSLIR
ncbi:MAM and LDL-receptor class A domain-containing protein 1-like [Amphibalanus amphitrite]|uniref:MAM and LDL-receptor class A domain-containing protein 1-like n=1 Tax=Amphibalanus amphitrite TaxID=1232801 RepID=UPI001C911D53|nr:MAM and LDL-receptor class A domain-containing protein 1-like [Amphibalanus amphitrite]